MKAILYADLLALKQTIRVLGLVLAFFILVSLLTGNLTLLGAWLAMLCIMLPLNLFSADASSGWERLSLSLPVSRQASVGSKYLLTGVSTLLLLVLFSAFFLVYRALNPMENLTQPLCVLLFSAGASLLLNSILLPLIYQFGMQKARLILLPLVWLPIIAGMLLSKTNSPAPSETLIPLTSSFILPLAALSLAGGVLALALSCAVSMRIYHKRQF